MKRYTIPFLFFSLGSFLLYKYSFSWVSFLLLTVISLLLVLFLYGLELEKQPIGSETLLEIPTSALESAAGSENTVLPEAEFTFKFPWDESPARLAKKYRNNADLSSFLDCIQKNLIPLDSDRMLSILYAKFDGLDFTEVLWQKQDISLPSLGNPLEWEEWEEERTKESLPTLSLDKKKYFIPLSMNTHLFGVVIFQAKEIWTEDDLKHLWDKTLELSEKIFIRLEHEKVTKDSKTGLFHSLHFYEWIREGFIPSKKETLVLLQFMNTKDEAELSVCLDAMLKQNNIPGIGLFLLEPSLYALITPNQDLDQFVSFLYKWVGSLEKLGVSTALTLGYSKTNVSSKEEWLRSAFLSLEENQRRYAA